GVSVRGADQVLFGGVAVVPVERCVEEALGEGGDCARVVADGCTGGDALEFLATGHPVTQSTQQHCQFGGLGPVVDVCLVHGDELPVPGVFAFEQVQILRAQQQVLQHRVVGQQQVRWVLPHAFTA